jgi:hypothetical protein
VLLTIALLDAAPVSQIVFVHDYLQIVFDDTRLSVYASATVSSGSRTLVRSEAGYCDALADLIGNRVTSVEYVRARQLRLTFEGGESVAVSLLSDGVIGPDETKKKSMIGIKQFRLSSAQPRVAQPHR